MLNNKYNIGEKVVCISGYSNNNTSSDIFPYGGSGYYDPICFPEIILTISGIIEGEKNGNITVYFFEDWTNGIYEFALMSMSELREVKLKLLDI